MTPANPANAPLYQALVENMATALLLVDNDGSLRYVNPAGEMLFGHSARQIQGIDLGVLFAGSTEFLQALERAGTGEPVFTEREIVITIPSQRRAITVDCTISVFAGTEGRTQYMVEIQPKDHLLRISREEQLLAQQAALRDLLRGLAHEVKNPLGGLRGAAQLLERELPDEELKEFTRVIIGEADRLQKLVDHMLGPNRPPHREPANLHEVLEHVRTLVLAAAPPGLTIRRDYDPSIPLAVVDRDQLVQAVLNIVRNAAEAVGEQGTITLRTRSQRRVTIGHTLHRLVARIEIIDDGPGIPDSVKDRLFYPMVTGRADGTGLGLSIAQSIVNQHGGLIQCRSEPGHTVFTMLMPLDQDADVKPTGETYG
mgnify:CR=1 FL=1